MSCIGYVDVNLNNYIDWYRSGAFEFISGLWTNYFYHMQSKELVDCYNRFTGNTVYSSDSSEDAIGYAKSKFNSHSAKYIKWFSDRIRYTEEFHQKVPVTAEFETFYICKFGSKFTITPKVDNVTTYIPLKNYDDLNQSEIKSIRGDIESTDTSLISESLSISKINAARASVENQLQVSAQTASDIKSGKVAELESLQAEVDAKIAELENLKQDLLDKLYQKQIELKEQQEKLNNELFLLSTQIYGIRCYLGEVIDIVKITSGKSADPDEPIVLYQKFHYLDEDFGKFQLIYNRSLANIDMFEKIFQTDKDLQQMICPSNKCVSVIRLCKDKTKFYQLDYSNILQTYEEEHGGQLGIVIRDGDNIYMCWTDDSEVVLEDDLFFVPGESVVSDGPQQSSTKHEVASRYFVFNILFGITSGPNAFIKLHKDADLLVPSKHVIYSAADGWLEDTRFGTFDDIITKCNKSIKVGDDIITLKYTPAERSMYRSDVYMNDRGRGDKNRTRGLYLPDNSIMKINYKDLEGSTLYYDTGVSEEIHDKQYDPIHNTFEDITKLRHMVFDRVFGNNDSVESMTTELKTWLRSKVLSFDESKLDVKLKENYYVSVLKDDSKYILDGSYSTRKQNSYSNFRIDSDEYVNVSVMNSAWLQYILITKRLGNLHIGSRQVTFSYVLPYIITMYKYIQKREQEEAEFINSKLNDSTVDDYPDWQVKLSEWKIETGQHRLHRNNVGKFVAYLVNENK